MLRLTTALTAILVASPALAATEIQWWHAMGGELGAKLEEITKGFNDSQDVPKALLWAQGKLPEADLDPDEARYFLSSLRLNPADVPRLKTWRKQLFLYLAHSAANRTTVFHLPLERTIVMGGQLDV